MWFARYFGRALKPRPKSEVSLKPGRLQRVTKYTHITIFSNMTCVIWDHRYSVIVHTPSYYIKHANANKAPYTANVTFKTLPVAWHYMLYEVFAHYNVADILVPRRTLVIVAPSNPGCAANACTPPGSNEGLKPAQWLRNETWAVENQRSCFSPAF